MQSQIDEFEVIKIVVKRLDSAGISYMITGSIAANFYTTPRMTRDLDIVIEVGENNAETLFSLFSDDFYIDKDSIKSAICNRRMFNIIHNKGLLKVDFIIKKDTKYRDTEFKRRRSIKFEGLKINITSPEDLILSKLFWAKESLSELQIKDVKNILKTVLNLDVGYIRKWVKELELEEIYKKVT